MSTDFAAERKRGRERIRRIVSLALPGQEETALRLAPDTDLSAERCATRLLAGVRTAGNRRDGNGHHGRPSTSIRADALQEAARRRLARSRERGGAA